MGTFLNTREEGTVDCKRSELKDMKAILTDLALNVAPLKYDVHEPTTRWYKKWVHPRAGEEILKLFERKYVPNY